MLKLSSMNSISEFSRTRSEFPALHSDAPRERGPSEDLAANIRYQIKYRFLPATGALHESSERMCQLSRHRRQDTMEWNAVCFLGFLCRLRRETSEEVRSLRQRFESRSTWSGRIIPRLSSKEDAVRCADAAIGSATVNSRQDAQNAQPRWDFSERSSVI
jgi:hypothetical protein